MLFKKLFTAETAKDAEKAFIHGIPNCIGSKDSATADSSDLKVLGIDMALTDLWTTKDTKLHEVWQDGFSEGDSPFSIVSTTESAPALACSHFPADGEC